MGLVRKPRGFEGTLIPGGNPNGQQQVFVYEQYKRGDSLVDPSNCSVADGCCNVANGCFTRHEGKIRRVSRKNCAVRNPSRCDSRR
ncbi:MAG: hypothetical protein ACI8TX_002313 [Hyphomicrobiaceae bacterium]|jgi:hypothetical protein